MECPICFEEFFTEKNVAMTECGHQFHTSCLLKSCLHSDNDYLCPLCRKELVKEENEEESASETEWETASEDDDSGSEDDDSGSEDREFEYERPRNGELNLDDLFNRMRTETSILQVAQPTARSLNIKIKTNFIDFDPTAEELHTPWYMLEVFENGYRFMSFVANLHNYYDADETKFHVQMALVDKTPTFFFDLSFVETKIFEHISHVTCGLSACERRWVRKSLPIIFSKIRELPEAKRYYNGAPIPFFLP